MGISINLTEGVGHCSPVTNMHNRKRDRSSQQFVADGSQGDLKGFLVAGDDEDLCLRPGVHVPFETLGAFLVHSWCILGAVLVHSWCILGAFLVHSWCILGAFRCPRARRGGLHQLFSTASALPRSSKDSFNIWKCIHAWT